MQNYNVCSKCRHCVWQDQCGSSEPCSHFDPIDSERYIEDQYSSELKLRRQNADITAAEQDNLSRE